jgi:hypothetical protein
MAPQNVVEQTISFRTTGNFDANILASPYIQNVAANSQGNIVTMDYRSCYHWNGTSFDSTTGADVQCYVTNTFSSQIQQTLSQLQAQFPGYTIITYATNVSYGT